MFQHSILCLCNKDQAKRGGNPSPNQRFGAACLHLLPSLNTEGLFANYEGKCE